MIFSQYFHREESRYTIPQMLRWLWQAWRGNRLQAMLNATVGLLGVVCSLASVWAMKRAIDIASGVLPGSVVWAVAVMALIILAEFGLGISRVWIKNILGIKAQNRMQQQMLAHLLRSEWRGREAMHSGDVINRLVSDVNHVVNFLTETLPSTLSTLTMFVGAFFYLFMMDRWLALVTVAILPVFILLSRFYVSRMRQLSRHIRQSDSLVQSLLTETMQHRVLVKTMEADGQMLDRLDDTQQELRQRVRRRTAFSVASNLVLNTGFSVGYLVAFLWGALRLQAGTITFGAMTAFLQLVYRIQGPARSLTKLAPAFVGVFTAAERLMELLEVPEEEQGEPQMLPAPCGVRFNDVSYHYADDASQAVISHADYDFAPGSCTAIMGETGTGKTTLIRLLLALVKPTVGSISIYAGAHEPHKPHGPHNPPPPKAFSLSPLHRCNFVYVPQGNTLLSGTLRENLLLGNPEATDDQMLSALHTVCADFVDSLPAGLDTRFSEHGGGLSEGQAQRIAIARALLRPGSIMLLDEATSALDPDTERQLLQNILTGHSHTVIFVTHRPSVLDYCDRIIRM
ncbi:MAG: ABC transporter ATP-binding protein [Prevotella sp.]|nr:ABC transporter ATP-binding protein [Prevotella sp.]